MKAKKQRRAGATETFSVSVDPETKKALRALAESQFGGNLSALITDLAAEARRRLAAQAYLRRQGIPLPTPERIHAIEADIALEVAAAKRRRRHKAA